MAASNNRIHEYDTVHHLTSRIAHQVYFLGEDERNDLMTIIKKAAKFSGIRLLGWCILSNHFHIMIHLPEPPDMDESELLRRYALLKGEAAAVGAAAQLNRWRKDHNAEMAERWLKALRRRMYDVGEFMKLIKQWFTQEYNRRQSHCGTLWSSAYHDKLVPVDVKSMSRVLAYIHLNPIRAALTDRFDDYAWSSFSALRKRDADALAGIRFVYDDENGERGELIKRHLQLLDALLENEKRVRAEEIAHKRANGYRIPSDPLTNEALVRQAAERQKAAQSALEELEIERKADGRKLHRKLAVADNEVLAVLRANPNATTTMIARLLGMAPSSVYERIRGLKNRGVVSRYRRKDPWQIHTIK